MEVLKQHITSSDKPNQQQKHEIQGDEVSKSHHQVNVSKTMKSVS